VRAVLCRFGPTTVRYSSPVQQPFPPQAQRAAIPQPGPAGWETRYQKFGGLKGRDNGDNLLTAIKPEISYKL